ncbi:24337_t:CDS:2, partial [Gigaspora rosea]
ATLQDSQNIDEQNSNVQDTTITITQNELPVNTLLVNEDSSNNSQKAPLSGKRNLKNILCKFLFCYSDDYLK